MDSNNPSIELNQNCLLGVGAFGSSVYEGTCSGKKVAVKRIPVSKEVDLLCQQIRKTLHDFGTTLELTNIIKYYSVIPDCSSILIAMEHCDMSMEDFLHKGLVSRNKLSVITQVLHGLNELHSKDIVHGDLTPSNVLLLVRDENLQVKISDFGMSKASPVRYKILLSSSTNEGCTEWMPSEVLKSLEKLAKIPNHMVETVSQIVKSSIILLLLLCCYIYP